MAGQKIVEINMDALRTNVGAWLKKKLHDIRTSKFPVLMVVRFLFMSLGSLIIGLGTFVNFFGSFQTDWDSGGRFFNLGSFLAAEIALLLSFGFLLVIAELIVLAMRIEDHLDKLRQMREQEIQDKEVTA